MQSTWENSDACIAPCSVPCDCDITWLFEGNKLWKDNTNAFGGKTMVVIYINVLKELFSLRRNNFSLDNVRNYGPRVPTSIRSGGGGGSYTRAGSSKEQWE